MGWWFIWNQNASAVQENELVTSPANCWPDKPRRGYSSFILVGVCGPKGRKCGIDSKFGDLQCWSDFWTTILLAELIFGPNEPSWTWEFFGQFVHLETESFKNLGILNRMLGNFCDLLLKWGLVNWKMLKKGDSCEVVEGAWKGVFYRRTSP